MGAEDERPEVNRLSRAVLVNEVLRLRGEVVRLKAVAYDQSEALIATIGELVEKLNEAKKL